MSTNNHILPNVRYSITHLQIALMKDTGSKIQSRFIHNIIEDDISNIRIAVNSNASNNITDKFKNYGTT